MVTSFVLISSVTGRGGLTAGLVALPGAGCACVPVLPALPLFSPLSYLSIFQISPYYCCDSVCPCFCRYVGLHLLS